jgi:hypothetical protein
MPDQKRWFSAVRCSGISIYAALQSSKINVFELGLANCQQALCKTTIFLSAILSLSESVQREK